MDVIRRLGERIRILRTQKGLSQEQLADLADTHTNYLGAIERGEKNITLDTLEKVAGALNVTLEGLFRYIDPMDKPDQIARIAGLLEDKSTEDRDFILHIVESMVTWKRN